MYWPPMRIGYWLLIKLILLLFLTCGCGPEAEKSSGVQEPVGKVDKVEGEALLFRPGAKGAVHLHLGDPLAGGDAVSTEGGGVAVVKVGETAEFYIKSGSRMWVNPRILGEKENPSIALQRGRVLVRSGDASKGGSPLLETAMFTFEAPGAEFEVAVGEDLGILVCVYKGRIRITGLTEPLTIVDKQEVELDFLDGSWGLRKLKERTDADWAAWMAGRFRILSSRFPELVTRMDRFLREAGVRRLEKRKQLDEKAMEFESKINAVARQATTEVTQSGSKGDDLLDAARSQAKLILEMRHLENRTEILLAEAERLRKRGQAMKKELGERFAPMDEILRLILDGGKVVRRSIEEERGRLLQCSQKWKENLATAGLISVASLEHPREPKPEPPEASKPKSSPSQAKAPSKVDQEEKQGKPSISKDSKASKSLSKTQSSTKQKVKGTTRGRETKQQGGKGAGSTAKVSTSKDKKDSKVKSRSKRE